MFESDRGYKKHHEKVAGVLPRNTDEMLYNRFSREDRSGKRNSILSSCMLISMRKNVLSLEVMTASEQDI